MNIEEFFNSKCPLTKERAISKWEPILNILKVEDEEIRAFMAGYCENVQNPELAKKVFENVITNPDVDPYGEENWDYDEIIDTSADISQNLLPISMKVLSQLNLKGKNLFLSEEKDVENFKLA